MNRLTLEAFNMKEKINRNDLATPVKEIYETRPMITEMLRQEFGPDAWDKLIEEMLLSLDEDEQGDTQSVL